MKQKKINITFVLPSLASGGAERVISFVAQNIDKTKFNTTLLVIGYENESAYTIEGIKVEFFDNARVLKGLPKLFYYMMRMRPHIVVSCMTHLNVLMSLLLILFPKIKLVARESNIKSTSKSDDNRGSLFSRYLVKFSCFLTDVIICQSKDMADSMVDRFHIKTSKLIIINNPISEGFHLKTLKEKTTSISQYITVGRLKKIKGHLRLLNILSKLEHPFHYTIIGSGYEFSTIMTSAKNLQIDKKITHVEFTDKVSDYLKESDVFLQGSFTEGFPNALLESCAVGTPVVAFDALGGTREIIEPNINGFIASNEKDFIRYLIQIEKDNPFDPKTVSDSVYAKFDKNTIIKKYEDVFLQLVEKQI